MSYTWKIQLAITTSFISSENIDEEHVIYTKRDNIEITNHEKADKVIQKILEFHFFRYQADIFFLDCLFFFFHFYCLNTLSPIFFPVWWFGSETKYVLVDSVVISLIWNWWKLVTLSSIALICHKITNVSKQTLQVTDYFRLNKKQKVPIKGDDKCFQFAGAVSWHQPLE